jgi:uncharacterized protein YcbK (DUF882 family)
MREEFNIQPEIFEFEAELDESEAAFGGPSGLGRGASDRIAAGELWLSNTPLLARHRGTQPDLYLRWNDIADKSAPIDIVIHLHGYSGRRQYMKLADKISISGIDSIGPSGGRTRPTLAIVPRGNYGGARKGANPERYDFPALTGESALQNLIAYALAKLAEKAGVDRLRRGRLIMTAHSGGGAPLNHILQYAANRPDEIHLFDATYTRSNRIADWAAACIARDQRLVAGAASPIDTMRARGGALRVFYRPDTGTQGYAREIESRIRRALGSDPRTRPIIERYYRIEATRVLHNDIPKRFGPGLLIDAAGDVVEPAPRPARSRSHARPAREVPWNEIPPGDAAGRQVAFPSGVSLRVVTGLPEGDREDYWDPWNSGNPLLDTGPAHKDKKLSVNLTVRELTWTGGKSVDVARIDPKLVACLQRLRDHLGKEIKINSGYRSWKRNKEVYAGIKNPDGTAKKPTLSQHCSGRAVDIKIAGMNGFEIAKAAIDACGPNIGVGLAYTFAHIDVRGCAEAWNYGGAKSSWISEIKRYQKQKGGRSCGAAVPRKAVRSRGEIVGEGVMSTPFEFEAWDSDVELGEEMHEFGDTETQSESEFGDGETEWESEFVRRGRRAARVAPRGIVRRRPSALWRAPRRPPLRPRPRFPVLGRPRFPVAPRPRFPVLGRPLFPVRPRLPFVRPLPPFPVRPRPPFPVRPRPLFPILPPWGGWIPEPPPVTPPPGQPPAPPKPPSAPPPSAEPFPMEPLAAEPMADEPMAAGPMADEPMAAEPMADEPMAAEPMADEPMAAEPMADEPMAAEPMADEPMAAEPPAQGEPPAEEFDIQPEAFAFESDFGEFESGLGEFETGWGQFESGAAGAPIIAPPCPPPILVNCPPRGPRPAEILDGIQFDRAALSSTRHNPRIAALARQIVQSQSSQQPIRSVLIVGHTDATGPERYNVGLGQRRATAAMQELCKALERMRPGVSRSIQFQLTSCGEQQTKSTPAQSRRVEIFFPRTAGPARGCPPYRERIRLHLKILVRPTVPIATMLQSMQQVYGPAGFLVEVASRENLRLPALEVLDVRCPGSTTQTCCPFPCPSTNLNAEHVALFQHRNNVGPNELAVYFVCQTIPDLRGCCAHPPGRPGAVVASSATRWTLGHEVGHVLGLQHVCDTNRLMNDGDCGGTAAITNPPPDLTAAEIQTMTASNLSIPC